MPLGTRTEVKLVELPHAAAGERERLQNGLSRTMGTSANLCAALGARDVRTGPRGIRFPRAVVRAPAGPNFLSTTPGACGPTGDG